MVIRIADHAPAASSYEDGEIIFRLLLKPVKEGERVEVDFSGIKSVPSAFINSAFIRLLEYVPFEQVRKTLTFIQSTRQINELIRSRFEFVTQHRGMSG